MMDNVSVISMFTLTGFNGTANHRVTLFALTLLCYGVICLANMTVIVTICMDKSLHKPMYIFLCNLCINGLYGTTGFYPRLLSDLLSSTHVISYSGCLLQGFVVHSSVCADVTLLALMAFDRYVALCQPLTYNSVMTKGRICVFLSIAWLVPIYLMLQGTIATSLARVCGSHIPRIYCINYFVNRLACTASLASVGVPAFNYTIYVLYFFSIVWSYIHLIKECIISSENRSKFMQTCLPHLFCLTILFVSMSFDLMFIRFGNKSISHHVGNFMSIEFLVIPPIFNPLIYGLKLTQIRKKITQFFIRKK
ncbi:olfactory receptor 2C3-like [Solea solea]|uniref:olfactory receptor 2C3-like n=1 Tax=Solea solea TaxID=90069 RepID=UPI00272ABDB8|nr:olfactory receptor 2C3-like [Solea solea]